MNPLRQLKQINDDVQVAHGLVQFRQVRFNKLGYVVSGHVLLQLFPIKYTGGDEATQLWQKLMLR